MKLNNLLTLTVSVDASYRDGKGACAYYIKHEKFVVKDSKYLGECSGSTEAEWLGIIEALNRALNECRYDIKVIYVTNDNQSCINRLKDWSHQLPYDLTADLLSLEIDIIPQKIDAHIGKTSPRTYINDWCDQNSRNCLLSNL